MEQLCSEICILSIPYRNKLKTSLLVISEIRFTYSTFLTVSGLSFTGFVLFSIR